VAATVAATGCATTAHRQPPTDLLFAWASDADRKDSDFLAVIDLRTNQVITTMPVGQSGTMAHHTDYEMPSDGTLMANDFYGNRTWLFDLSDPLAPKVRWSVADVGPLSFAHSFARLPNGRIVATMQRGNHANETPGGIAEFATNGRLLRWASADPGSQEFVRPYSLAIVPKLGRIVTTTADMGSNMPAMPNMPAMASMCFDASRLTCSELASSNCTSRADARMVPLAMRGEFLVVFLFEYIEVVSEGAILNIIKSEGLVGLEIFDC